MYAKDLSEPKYEPLIEKREDAGTKHLNDPEPFIKFSNTMDGVYEVLMVTTQAEKEKSQLCLIT